MARALLLTKNVYWFFLTEKLKFLTESVQDNDKEFDRHLIMPERDDLDKVRALLQAYKEDLNIPSLTFAPLPEKLNTAL